MEGPKTLWVVMEYMNAGCLTDILNYHDQFQMKENHMAYCLREILLGLNYIHSLQRIHRDIKSDNILINLQGYFFLILLTFVRFVLLCCAFFL